MNFEIEKQAYEEIAKLIHSESSPVGIDAKKTHILILKMLSDLNQRMDNIEELLREKK